MLKLAISEMAYLMTKSMAVKQCNILSAFLLAVVFCLAWLYPGLSRSEIFIESKVGIMMLDEPSSNDPINMTLNLGYRIDTTLADLSVVGELNRTVNSGESSQGEELKMSSNGIYLRWMSIRSLFVTLRGGFVENKVDVGNRTDKSYGVGLGGGIGIVIGKTRLHLEYMSLAGDAKFLSIGLEY